jgi:hypothetical protein
MSEELVDMLVRKPCRTAETPLNIIMPPADPMERIRMAVEREYARKLYDLLYVSTYWGYERKLSPAWTDPLEKQMQSIIAGMKTTDRPDGLSSR